MKIRKDTIVRTLVLAAAILNQFLTARGKCPLPLKNEELAELLSAIFTAGASIWAWWKNNSFTKAACEADKILMEKKELK